MNADTLSSYSLQKHGFMSLTMKCCYRYSNAEEDLGERVPSVSSLNRAGRRVPTAQMQAVGLMAHLRTAMMGVNVDRGAYTRRGYHPRADAQDGC